MIFEYLYEVTDPVVVDTLQEKMKTTYRISGIQLCCDFNMDEGKYLESNSTEILYVVDTESDIPIMVNKGQKFIIGDCIDYDKVDAECYAQWDRETKSWSEYYD